jgi:hypothetical protein
MKKTFIAFSFTLIAVSAGAQTMKDALTFSQNNYYGTARTIGMGNAVTAVGGDLGTIGINPAGSAVYNYSQFTITPNLTISSEISSFSAYPVDGKDHFKNEQTRNLTRFSMPNIGATFNMDMGRRSGLKNITFGFVCNGTNNFTSQMMGGGVNDRTSYLSSMAVNAFGFDSDFLNGNGYMDASGKFNEFSQRQPEYPFNNADDRGRYAPWNTILNSQAGAIATFGDNQDPDYFWRYIAATEGYTDTGETDKDGNHIYDIRLGGPLDQAFGRKVTGSKFDAIFNTGFNFSDYFYIGANIGFTSMNYDYDEYFKEYAVDKSDFPIEYSDGTTYFNGYRNRYSYSAEGEGIYAKLGFIAVPVKGLRIGAAIQSPTAMHIDEIYRQAVDVSYSDSKYDGSAVSPEGNFSYYLTTPYIANAGVAYSFLGMVLLSADYEITDYSRMKFRTDENYNSSFDDLNSQIRDCMGLAQTIRVGAEFKPIPELAVRAGYNYSMIPEYSYADSGFEKYTLKDKINSFAVGLGYYSSGSFFADVAARGTFLYDETIFPYADYLDDCASPAILNKRERYDLTLTLGWRF